MLPRLHAQEQLYAVEAAALGSGALKRWDAERLLGRLRRLAQGLPDAQPQRPSPAALAAMGIAVKVVAKAESDG